MEDCNVQKCALGVLEEFDRICRLHSIKYSLAYGTLLGAVRHKGYIPWDDDVDVIMVREEYEKLLKYTDKLKSNYSFISVDNNLEYTAPLAKLYDNRTELIEYEHRDNIVLGIYVDIFVLDYLPENKLYQKCFYAISYLSQKIWSMATYGPKTNIFLERWLRNIALTLGWGRFMSRVANNFYKKSPHSSIMANLLYNDYMFSKETILTSDIKDYKEISFEGKKFMSFKNDKFLLEKWYGDYMELPPEENRVSKHNFYVKYKN